jgi:1,4-alpha-glucan branching enzyme
MATWPKRPIIYEINTWVWLQDLSQRYQREVTLETVPESQWDGIADLRVDAVWFMGVWERSPAGSRIAREHRGLQEDFSRTLPDFTPEDVVGSPYCVRRYGVDEHLGGTEGLRGAREMLAKRHILLMLDFVPNHIAPDHPWVFEHPEYLIQGDSKDLATKPYEFLEVDGKIFAHGRDPYFPAWTDTVQLNAFAPELRQAVIETIRQIADQCDGVRCDMAMLLITRVFEQTWAQHVVAPPKTEFWREVIEAVRKTHPEFVFMAESYWDLEWELQQQGFDYCYDKRLHDRLGNDAAESIKQHVQAEVGYQEKLVRFIENHDEPRAAATYSPQRSYAAAVIMSTLPGAKLFHEGQLEGWQVKLPVQLGRRPAEGTDENFQTFYRELLKAINLPPLREGEWKLCEWEGWPDNHSYRNLVAWCWRKELQHCLVVVNFSGWMSQGRVRLPWNDLAGQSYHLADAFSGDIYIRDGAEMRDPGLFVDLEPWGFHFLCFGEE